MRRILAGLVALLLARGAVAEERVLSVSEALQLAMQAPALQAAHFATLAAGFAVEEVKATKLPQLEVAGQARSLNKDPGFLVPRGAFGNPVALALVTGERDVQEGRLQASYVLWDWGRRDWAVKAARKEEEAAAAQEGTLRRSLLLAALRAFAAAQQAQGELEALEAAVATAQETLRVVTAMVKQQLLPDSDRLAAEFFLAQRQAELAQAKAHHAAALAMLRELTGQSCSGVEAARLPPLASLPEAGEGEREEVRQAAAQAQAAEALARVFQREAWPVVWLAAGAENVRDHFLLHQSNSYGVVGLRANLFDGGKSRAVAARYRALAKAAEAQKESRQRAVDREVAVARAQVRAFWEQQRAAESAVAAAQEELRVEQLRHGQGFATTRDLLAAQEHVARARAALAGARAGFLVAAGELVAAAGQDVLAFFGGGQ